MTPDQNPLITQIDIGGIWHIGYFVGLSLSVLFLLWKLIENRKIDYWMGALWAYVLIYALYVIEYPAVPYGIYNTAFQVTAGQAFIEALMIPLIAIFLPQRRYTRLIVEALVIVEIICVWTGQGKGLQAWSSFDCALIALCLPLIDWRIGLISFLTILFHHGSTALLILAVQFFAYALNNKRFWKWFFLAIPIFMLVSHSHQLHPWWDSGERLETYKRFMTFWNAGSIKRHFIGTGAGSFMWISLLLDQYHPPLWLSLHSDWLQVLFEYGAVGLSLTIGVMVRLLYAVKRDPQLLGGLLGVCAFGVSYHPMHFFASAFVCCLIVNKSQKRKISNGLRSGQAHRN